MLADISPGLPGKQLTQVCDLLTGSLLGVESVGKVSVSGSVGGENLPQIWALWCRHIPRFVRQGITPLVLGL